MSSPRFSLSCRGAFTLVELLTVMAIIAILMGILFPTIGSALESAKKTQAKNDELQLVNAIKTYYTEYGKYPYDSAGAAPTDDTKTLTGATLAPVLAELRAKNTAATSINPRKIVFLEIPDAKNLGQANKERGGMATATDGGTAGAPVWLDPWGKSYSLVIDYDYGNSVPNPYGAPATGNAGSDPVSTAAIVYSVGRDGIKATNVKGSDDVISWQ
ncbi:MAG TPA: type II secretion system protein [Chthoniobacterales bacterium]